MNDEIKEILDFKENERLKQEYINVKNYIVLRKIDGEVQNKATLYNIELENINKKRYEDYKSRIEKAIEYIKSNYPVCAGKDLLNILNGRSDE